MIATTLHLGKRGEKTVQIKKNGFWIQNLFEFYWLEKSGTLTNSKANAALNLKKHLTRSVLKGHQSRPFCIRRVCRFR
jgi:hypothetical protein